MATLYKITDAINSVIENGFSLDEETGEVFDSQDLETLGLDFETKAENVACYIKNLQSDAAAIREEEKNLAARRQSKERKAQRLKEYLEECLLLAGTERIETPRCKISFRSSTKIEIVEESLIPDDYMRFEAKPNKAALKEAIKNGEKFNGVELVTTKSIQLK